MLVGGLGNAAMGRRGRGNGEHDGVVGCSPKRLIQSRAEMLKGCRNGIQLVPLLEYQPE